jgi:hypothetical protein
MYESCAGLQRALVGQAPCRGCKAIGRSGQAARDRARIRGGCSVGPASGAGYGHSDLQIKMPGERGGERWAGGEPLHIIHPGYPGRWVGKQLLDLLATREVIGYAHLEERRGKAVGEVLVVTGATDVGGTLGSACEPVLVLHSGANAEAIGYGEVRTAAEGDEVIADRRTQLIELGGKIERTIACGGLEVRAPTAVVPVVTDSILKSPLFSGGVLEDRNRIEGQLGSPVGGEIYVPEDAITDGVLRSIVGDCVGKEPACLNIKTTSRTGYSLSESKRGESSRHSQDEDNSFQWMASIGRGMGSVRLQCS